MIIDGHTHIFPDEVRKDRQAYCKRDQGFSSIYKDSKARMAGVEDLIASMDEYGIERSVICGFPWSEPDLCSLHNRYLMESASRYPHRLIVFIILLFSDPGWSEKELEVCLKEGVRGVGEVAFYRREMTSPGHRGREAHSHPDGKEGNSFAPSCELKVNRPFVSRERGNPWSVFMISLFLFRIFPLCSLMGVGSLSMN